LLELHQEQRVKLTEAFDKEVCKTLVRISGGAVVEFELMVDIFASSTEEDLLVCICKIDAMLSGLQVLQPSP
jgi:hypothetical protein